MGEKDGEEIGGSNLSDRGLQDHIAHWSEVLDRWVNGIDLAMGRNADPSGPRDRKGKPLDGKSRRLDGASQPTPHEVDADPDAQQ
jgi:hypothetical protein